MIKEILNSKQQKICVKTRVQSQGKGSKLVFICHGITSYKEFPLISSISDTFFKQGYNVVTFDCRNSLGKSFSDGRCATLTDFFDDLESVIDWAASQSFFTPKFALAGHSLGGGVVINYTLAHPEKVSLLATFSGVFSGEWLELSYKANNNNFYQQLKNETIVRTRNNKSCLLDYSFIKDALKYDFVKEAERIRCPMLIVTGENDLSSTSENNQIFCEKLIAPKKISIIKDCGHIYDKTENKKDLRRVIKSFLAEY